MGDKKWDEGIRTFSLVTIASWALMQVDMGIYQGGYDEARILSYVR